MKRSDLMSSQGGIGADLLELPHVQGSSKRWALGCVIPASWPPLAAGGAFHATEGPLFSRSLYMVHIGRKEVGAPAKICVDVLLVY